MKKIIINSANAGLKLQRKDGSFKPGHNGPWNDVDTATRVTAHWTIVFIHAYKLTKNIRFKTAAKKAGEYLISEKCRPHEYSFYCRKTKNKNKKGNKNRCNGLIGQAWSVEALIELSKLDNKYLKTAEDVLLKHPFNNKLGLWYNLEINGRRIGLNRVLNQQTWFAAMVCEVANTTKNRILEKRFGKFVEKLPANIEFNGKYANHLIYRRFDTKILDKLFRFMTRKLAVPVIFGNEKLNKTSIGYSSFMLHGLAIMHDTNPKLKIWDNRKVIEIIIQSIGFLNKNVYSMRNDPASYLWAYNATGFEVAYAITSFRINSIIKAEQWAEMQLKKHFNLKTGLMNKNTEDPITLSSRIYEAVKISNMTVDVLKF